MRRRALLGLTLALAGCGALSPTPYVARRTWPLVVRRPDTATASGTAGVLLVRTMTPAPGLDARGLLTMQTDGSINADYYEEWAVSPADAIEDDLRRWLADSGLFAAVLAPGSRIDADLVLESELTALWFDRRSGKVRLTVALVLSAPRGADEQVLLQRSFAAEVAPAGTDPAAIVAATRQALAQVLQAIETAVAPYARAPRSGGLAPRSSHR
ncbi:MAG: membrane integrity-associated transporter subunit PqiC [Alphaproteobacteria bacterium]|nr:membrane integrity-associated transporter subunit PqiC [Alphaproteobacteria bacterium]